MCVVALSIAAFTFALTVNRIKELVEIASAFGSAGVFVTAMFALFTSIGGPWAAISSILAGAGVWALGKFGLDWSAPYLTALAVATVAYLRVIAADPDGVAKTLESAASAQAAE